MSHVPEANLMRYRHLRGIVELLDSAGDHLGAEFMEDANQAWAMAGKYRRMAEELRYKPDGTPPKVNSK